MEFLLILIACAIAVALAWYFAKCFFEVAKTKGFSDKKYFWICFLLGTVGYLLVIALPDRGNYVQSMADDLPDL